MPVAVDPITIIIVAAVDAQERGRVQVQNLESPLPRLSADAKPEFAQPRIDVNKFEAVIQQGFIPGPGYCCASALNFQTFLNWFYSQGWFHVYPVFEQGEEAYEQHDGCVVVPYDVLGVTPFVLKDPFYTVTPAYKVKTIWCLDQDCNWKLTGMEWRSFTCLNVNTTVCAPP